jgi:CHRD domain
MRAGLTYANVHTTNFPNGEIRGQIRGGGGGDGDDDDDD